MFAHAYIVDYTIHTPLAVISAEICDATAIFRYNIDWACSHGNTFGVTVYMHNSFLYGLMNARQYIGRERKHNYG